MGHAFLLMHYPNKSRGIWRSALAALLACFLHLSTPSQACILERLVGSQYLMGKGNRLPWDRAYGLQGAFTILDLCIRVAAGNGGIGNAVATKLCLSITVVLQILIGHSKHPDFAILQGLETM